METKICSKCNIEKNINDFHWANKKKNKKKDWCKICANEYNRKYRKENINQIRLIEKKYRDNNQESVKKSNKKSKEKNKDKISAYRKKYYLENREKLLENRRTKDKNNRKQINKKYNDKSKNDFAFRLRKNVSRLILSALKREGSSKNGKSILEYLTFTIEQLKNFLEEKFKLPGNEWMNWNNYGPYRPKTHHISPTWQLDHIIPQSDLPYISMEDENFKKCWALENLRPLDAKQNLLDGVNRTRHKKKRK